MIQLTFGFPPTIVVLHYVSRVESERESLLWGRGRLTGLGPDCFTNTFGVFVCHQYVWWTCVNPMPFEGRALLYCICLTHTILSQQTTQPTTLQIRIDNTSLIGALNKTRSRSWELNNIVGKILPHMAQYTTEVRYVRSKDNVADKPSRNNTS